jgi:hypothetical protein
MPKLELSVIPCGPIIFEENIFIFNPADLHDNLKLNAAFSALEKNSSRVLILPYGPESWRFYRGMKFINLEDKDINVIQLYLSLTNEFKPQYNNTFSALQVKVNDGIFFTKEDPFSIKRIEAKTIYADRKSTSFNSKVGEKGKFSSVLDFKTKTLILREGGLIKPEVSLKLNPVKLSEVENFVNNVYDSANKDDQLRLAKNATISILKTEINNLIITKK